MRLNLFRGLARASALSAVVAMVACQGNIGGGSGLSIPQGPSYNQPAGPQNGYSQTRERVLDGAVYLGSKLTEVPLPELGGFGIAIELGTPSPSPPSPGLQTPAGSARPAAAGRATAAAVAGRAAVPVVAGRAAAAAGPVAGASPSPLVAPSATAAIGASPSPSGSASAPADAPSASAKASRAPSPAASGPGPKIITKTVIYPDDAPAPPTPIPTGEVQVFIKRSALVRGYLQPETDISLYGLAAVRFTIPSSELEPKRGFTIALYQNGKHRHDRLLAYDTDATAANAVVTSALTEPLILKKGIGYLVLLYGDDTPPTPAPVAPGFASPGYNPFPMPSGNASYPPGTAPYGSPTPYNPYATPTPYGAPTPYNPYATPTPYNPYATPTPYHL